MGLSDELNKFIPKDFGKKKKANAVSATDSSNISVSHSTDRQQPAVAATLPEAEESVASKPLDNRAASDDAEPLKVTDIDEEYPVDSQIVMMEHNKAISAVAWDPSGDVLASGDHGSLVHLWDFGAMDGAYRSTRTLVPFEGQQVRDLRFNRAGTLLLCATSDPRAKLYDIDGRAVCEFKRGDMYVSDMRKTKGHVAGLFSVDWSPHHDDVFASASADGTVRIWSCDRPMAQDHVLVGRGRNAGSVTACKYSNGMGVASVIATAQTDGSMSLWPASGPYLRPTSRIENAHNKGTETRTIVFAPDGHSFATRSDDSVVKLWDLRSLLAPIATSTLSGPSRGTSGLSYSPSGKHILAGGERSIAVLCAIDLAARHHIPVGGVGGVGSVLWHPQVNQIAAACADRSISVMYSAESSTRGAKLCVGKRVKRRVEGITAPGPIITPHALPLFRDDSKASSKRARQADKQKPGQPIYGHGRGGQIGVNETQHIMKSIIKDTMRDEDPREALLKYAAVAESDPMFVAPAYRATQDKPIFDKEAGDSVPEMKRRK